MDTNTLFKYFKRELDPSGDAQVSAWLADDPDGSHLEAYKDARILFEGIVLYSQSPAPVKKVSFRKKFTYAVAAAASLAVLVVSSVMLTRNEVMTRLASSYNTFKTSPGQNLQMTLPDGTLLWLSPTAEIHIPQVFEKDRREIKVENGEVYLEVARDEDRPFVVDTYAGEIQVLGTKFDLAVDEDNEYFHAALLEGSIKVVGKKDSSVECVMKPNEMLKMTEGTWTLGKMADSSDVTSWTEGIINVVDVTFKELMDRFERLFGVEVIIVREDMPRLHYTRGKIRMSDGIEHALDALKMGSDFTYERDRINNRIYIR